MKTQTILLSAALAGTAAWGANALGGQAAPVQRDKSVLDRWVGSWETRVDLQPSVWVPTRQRYVSRERFSWILDGQFLEGAVESEQGDSLEILRVDPKTGAAQRWSFDAKGETSYWTGEWDKKAEVMQWAFDFGVIKGTMEDRFDGEDEFTTALVVTDLAGKSLLEGTLERRRVEVEPEESK